jgi:hypothetical protein
MNKRMSLLLAVLVILAMGSTAQAQPDWTALPSAMGIHFNQNLPVSDYAHRCYTPTPFVNFQAYLVGTNITAISGFEATLTVNPLWTVLSYVLNPENALNVSAAPTFIVGLGASFNGDPNYTLVTANMAWFSFDPMPEDDLLCVGPTGSESSLIRPNVVLNNEIVEANDLWDLAECDIANQTIDQNCGLLNPVAITCPTCIVATETSTFGAIKARY